MEELRDPLADLAAEQEQLEAVVESIDEAAAARPSACEGWSVSDVVLHLAQTEEMVTSSIEGGPPPDVDAGDASTIDELMARWVEAERGEPFEKVRLRWIEARRAALDSLRNADPSTGYVWAAAPLKPRTLATTRLSEHWIHAQDIAGPLGIDYPDTDRLWHIARLAQRTIPYAFMRAGAAPPPEVRVRVTSPSGDEWSFGPDDAPVHVEGPAGEFCRIAARRLDPAETTVTATGERAPEVLSLVRTYA